MNYLETPRVRSLAAVAGVAPKRLQHSGRFLSVARDGAGVAVVRPVIAWRIIERRRVTAGHRRQNLHQLRILFCNYVNYFFKKEFDDLPERGKSIEVFSSRLIAAI